MPPDQNNGPTRRLPMRRKQAPKKNRCIIRARRICSDAPSETAQLSRGGRIFSEARLRRGRRVPSRRAPVAPFRPATRREQEVVRLVCEGRSNQEIADDAGLSLPTVKKHVHAIFRKLEVSSRSRLMALMR
jgi:DNA-binding NarL/FixJ family response regulator